MDEFNCQVDMLLIGECRRNYRNASVLWRERFLELPPKSHMAFKRLEARSFGFGSRELARNAGVSKTSVLRILRSCKFHSYHISLHQELYGQDFDRRLEFCNWFRGWIADNHPLENILLSDEATFTNHGHVNRHNMHYWADENPPWLRTVANLHPWTVNTWCGILGETVIGPYFFNGTLDGARYCDFLQNDLPR